MSDAKCTCPYQYDERTGGSVRAGLDQFCPLHGSNKPELPHCATCTCGVGSKIVQVPKTEGELTRAAESESPTSHNP